MRGVETKIILADTPADAEIMLPWAWIALAAAIPLAVHRQASTPSSAAIFCSSIATVGLPQRA